MPYPVDVSAGAAPLCGKAVSAGELAGALVGDPEDGAELAYGQSGVLEFGGGRSKFGGGVRAGLGFGVAGSLDLREVCSHAVGELDPYVEVDGAGLEAGHDRDQVAGHVVDLVDGAGLGAN